MKKAALLLLLLLLLLPLQVLYSLYSSSNTTPFKAIFHENLPSQNSLRLIAPIYLRLKALQEGNTTLWESVPQNFSDHVATINSKTLVMFVASNCLGFNLSRDSVGNLWMASNYSLTVGDYVSTLAWVSSEAISENITSPGFVHFPESYPDSVRLFLNTGKKIQVGSQEIQKVAADFNQTNNVTQVVRNVLDFGVEQEYDHDKTRLLMSGDLNTSNIFDFFKDAIQVHKTNSSMCLERAWYATAILRAAGVPTRTVTDVRLKTWIQVWLQEYGWVDAESLCVQPPPMFPRPLSSSTPWMIENDSDAAFPFAWTPRMQMRIVNLTFGDIGEFSLNQFRTALVDPVDDNLFRKNPTKFRFPIVFKPDLVYAAVTQEGSRLTFSLFKENENASKVITLGESNSIPFGEVAVSFKPIRQDGLLILQDFAVQEISRFDIRILAPVLGVPIAAVIVWFILKKSNRTRHRL